MRRRTLRAVSVSTRARGLPGGRAHAALAAGLSAMPLFVICAFFAWPVLAIVGLGFGLSLPGSQIVSNSASPFAAFVHTLSSPRTWEVLGRTIAQGLGGATAAVVLGLPLAHLLYRRVFRGAKVLRAAITVPFVLPTIVVAVAFGALVGEGGWLHWLGLDRTYWVVVWAFAAMNVSLIVRVVGPYWARLSPKQVEAAMMLGASPLRAWWTVTLPALIPAIASAAVMVFLYCASSFALVLVLGGRSQANLETEIYRATVQLFNLPSASVLALVQIVFIGGVLAVSAHLRQRFESASQSREHTRPLSREDSPVLAVCGVISTVLYVLPAAAIVTQAFRTKDGSWTLQHFAAIFSSEAPPAANVTIAEAALTSVIAAAWATILTLACALCACAVLAMRTRTVIGRRLQQGLDMLMMLPVGVSAVTLGFGLLIAMYQPFGLPIDLRAWPGLVPIAQALVALPLVMRTLLPVLRGIGPRMREAAATLGSHPGRVLLTIDAPIAARAIGTAVGFAFATALGEFGASSFLVQPARTTLPVLIGSLSSTPGSSNYGIALAASLLLGAIVAVVMLLAERLHSRHSMTGVAARNAVAGITPTPHSKGAAL